MPKTLKLLLLLKILFLGPFIFRGLCGAPAQKMAPNNRYQGPANGPTEIYQPYLELFYPFKTPVLVSEGGGLSPSPRTV